MTKAVRIARGTVRPGCRTSSATSAALVSPPKLMKTIPAVASNPSKPFWKKWSKFGCCWTEGKLNTRNTPSAASSPNTNTTCNRPACLTLQRFTRVNVMQNVIAIPLINHSHPMGSRSRLGSRSLANAPIPTIAKALLSDKLNHMAAPANVPGYVPKLRSIIK